MKPGTNRTIRWAQELDHVQRDGPNWVLIAGSAVLSALSIRIGCKLKQAFETKQANTPDFTMKDLVMSYLQNLRESQQHAVCTRTYIALLKLMMVVATVFQ